MLTAILIIVISAAMLLYWFRYSCILILRNQLEREASAEPQAIQDRIHAAANLDSLHQELDRDYKVLTYLLAHATGLELASFEHKLLMWDCRMMRYVYRITRLILPDMARNALCERAEILEVLGGHLKQQSGISDIV